MKKCTKCSLIKHLSDFSCHKGRKDGLDNRCRSCNRLAVKNWKNSLPKERIQKLKDYLKVYGKEHPTKWEDKRNRRFISNYGITLEDYNRKMQEQAFRCGTCSKHVSEPKRNLSIDHNHKTSKVRGLLCDSCNLRLGTLTDSAFVLCALEYLKKYENLDNTVLKLEQLASVERRDEIIPQEYPTANS